MKFSNVTTFVVVFFPLLLNSAEPSAFGAGKLENSNPYGLTSEEKVLLENKKHLRKIQIQNNSQESAFDILKERVDGIQSITESLGKKSHKNKTDINRLDIKILKKFDNMEIYSKRLSDEIQNNVLSIRKATEDIQQNTDDIQRIKLAISEISQMLDIINAKYISKEEFNVLVKDINEFKSLMAKELKNIKIQSTPKKSEFDDMSNGDVATKAKKFYSKKQYSKAIRYYRHLISKNYRPANSHYMLGELYYKQRNYSSAISYFKKSASLYKKAKYSPKLLATLMLHTAISMKKTKDINNAKTFFRAVILKYPNLTEAQEAQKYLSSLE